MRNRAKCKLCNDIIESFHSTDYMICKCGEISVEGGNAMRCASRDWKNFLRVDDEGNEILVKVGELAIGKITFDADKTIAKPNKEELFNMLQDIAKTYQELPQIAKNSYVTNYELESILLLLLSIFRSLDSD